MGNADLLKLADKYVLEKSESEGLRRIEAGKYAKFTKVKKINVVLSKYFISINLSVS